jgi:gamma-glutamyltranspeptidase / glutathione hydrolase
MAQAAAQHRGVVVAKNGMVAASQPLAVSAGLNALQQGGSFADAAIAASAVLCVVEPYASHLGGDAFIIVYDAPTGATIALNGSGAAPAAATPDRFAGGIPMRGIAAASVPGLVDAWEVLHERWGRTPVAELLAPAISYAGDGFPLAVRSAQRFGAAADIFGAFPETADALLTDGEMPAPGATIVQPDLAWTLEQIAAGGANAFYRGEITNRMLAYSEGAGGLFSAEDFANYRTQVGEPIRTSYRGYTVHGQPPVSQGHILLQMLNLVEGFDLAGAGHNSADAIHLQVEAKKLAFADRAAYLGDPKFVSVPMETLLSKGYADARRGMIDRNKAAYHVSAGAIDHDTTYFCVVDGDGSAVSFIQSVFWGFGCGAVARGTGVLFNNRMTGFSLDPASPNVLAPGKRTAHTLNAYVVTRDDTSSRRSGGTARAELAWVGGTPGGDVQVQSNLQVLCNVIDFGMNPQAAVEAPRWQHGGSVGAADEPGARVLAVEDRVPASVFDELASRGHRVEPLGPWSHGSAYQLIAVDPATGALMGGSDPRVDGHAAGY